MYTTAGCNMQSMCSGKDGRASNLVGSWIRRSCVAAYKFVHIVRSAVGRQRLFKRCQLENPLTDYLRHLTLSRLVMSPVPIILVTIA